MCVCVCIVALWMFGREFKLSFWSGWTTAYIHITHTVLLKRFAEPPRGYCNSSRDEESTQREMRKKTKTNRKKLLPSRFFRIRAKFEPHCKINKKKFIYKELMVSSRIAVSVWLDHSWAVRERIYLGEVGYQCEWAQLSKILQYLAISKQSYS